MAGTFGKCVVSPASRRRTPQLTPPQYHLPTSVVNRQMQRGSAGLQVTQEEPSVKRHRAGVEA